MSGASSLPQMRRDNQHRPLPTLRGWDCHLDKAADGGGAPLAQAVDDEGALAGLKNDAHPANERRRAAAARKRGLRPRGLWRVVSGTRAGDCEG